MKHKFRNSNILKTEHREKHLAPAIGAALIGGASSLIGGLIGSKGQSNSNAANERINERTLQWQEEMWNKTNEYNTPSAQRQRLLEAGINPLSAIGGVQNSQAQNMAAPSQLPMQNDMAALGQGVSDAGLKAAQIANLNADTQKKEAESLLTDEQKVALQWSNKFTKEMYNARTTTEQAKLYKELLESNQGAAMINMFMDELDKEGSSMPDTVKKAFYAQFESLAQQVQLQIDQHDMNILSQAYTRQEIQNIASMQLLAWATYIQTGSIAEANQAVEKYKSDNVLKGQKYQTDGVVKAAGISAGATVKSSQISAGATVKSAEIHKETETYKADKSAEVGHESNSKNPINIVGDAVKGVIKKVQGDDVYQGVRIP